MSTPKDILIYRAVQDPAFLERFWAKVDRSAGQDGCWPWMAGTTTGGYGTITLPQYLGGQGAPAHRVAWIIEFGEVPDFPDADYRGTIIRHSCDNPPCCNASRCLLPGTHADNMADMVSRGRQIALRGSAHPASRFPELWPRGEEHYTRLGITDDKRAQIALVFELHGRGLSQRGIGESVGLSQRMVGLILTGAAWGELTTHLRNH